MFLFIVQVIHCVCTYGLNHRIIELFSLEKTSKIIEFNHKNNTAKSTTKPCP